MLTRLLLQLPGLLHLLRLRGARVLCVKPSEQLFLSPNTVPRKNTHPFKLFGHLPLQIEGVQAFDQLIHHLLLLR
jgi:hypothetical protein